jgi:hypothetical protein
MTGGHRVIIFGFLPQNLKTMAVAVAFSMAWRGSGVEGRAGEDQARGLLEAFRGGLYRCFTGRADALFELADSVLCADGRCGCWPGCRWCRSTAAGTGRPYDAARDSPPVSPVLSASWRSRASPAYDTMPSPSAVTSRLFDHPVRFTFEVLLELALIRASVLLSSHFRSTFYRQRVGQLSVPVKS